MPRRMFAAMLGVLMFCAASLAQPVTPPPAQPTPPPHVAKGDPGPAVKSTKGDVKTRKGEPGSKGAVSAGKSSDDAIPGEVDVHFLNGSIVRMIVRSESLDVATQYGKLTVPIKDIVGIDFGLHFPPGVLEKVTAAVKNLGSNSYATREEATKTLLDLGPLAFPAVTEAARDRDTEIAGRAQGVLKALKAKHSKADLKATADDRVITANFTIVGRILNNTIKAKTEYFGDAELSLAKMRILRSVGGAGQDMKLSVDAFKHSTEGQWMDTKYRVNGKTTISITAKGLIDSFPQQPGQYMSGPNGNPNNNRWGGGGAVARPGRIAIINAQQHSGMLLGKIGEEGDVFFVGERYEGTPDAEGTLYLIIGPSQWNCPASGTYEVHISRKN